MTRGSANVAEPIEFHFEILSTSVNRRPAPVVRKNSVRSCRDFFQPVFVMQSARHSLPADSIALRKAVSMLRLGRRGVRRCRDTRSQAHVNAAVIVVAYPAIENVLEMPLSQRYEEIQTLPADRSDEAFANGICLGRSRRRPQYPQALAATP